MTPELMRGVSVSDIHLGNTRIDNISTIRAMKDIFSPSPFMDGANVAIIAGDLWDRLLNLNHPDLNDIFLCLKFILRFCKERNITLIVLEGTRSHDWNQSEILEIINNVSELGADLHYVKSLQIKYFERFDKHILFVPDDIHHDHDVIFDMVTDELKKHNLDKVDLAVMHGMFRHQVPAGLNLPCHDNERYETIVKDAIFVGHVHLHTEIGKIYAQGSLPRFSHGEEEPKGYFRFFYTTHDKIHVEFVENKRADLFITLDCLGLNASQTYEKVADLIKEKGERIYIRIMSEGTNPIFSNMDELSSAFPLTRFSEPKKIKEKKSKNIKEGTLSDIFVPIPINRDNVGQLIQERISSKGGLGKDVMDTLLSSIEQIR